MPTITTPKKVTRLDREEAARAAGSVDLAPVKRGVLVGLIVLAFALLVSIVMPGTPRFGGPLQDGNVVAGATMTTVRKAGDDVVTIGLLVPWNAGTETAVLEWIAPIRAEGVEMVRSGLPPPGLSALEPTRGFPPSGLTVVSLERAPIPPGSGPLDGTQIVVGLRGKGTVLGFVLRYRVGGATHDALLMSGVMLCGGSCEDKAGAIERQQALGTALVGFVDAPLR